MEAARAKVAAAERLEELRRVDLEDQRRADERRRPPLAGTAEMTTMACASGKSSVSERSTRGSSPCGVMHLSCSAAPPVSAMVGWPERMLTTPMSRQKTPRRMPVPSALAQASLAAKRLA